MYNNLVIFLILQLPFDALQLLPYIVFKHVHKRPGKGKIIVCISLLFVRTHLKRSGVISCRPCSLARLLERYISETTNWAARRIG